MVTDNKNIWMSSRGERELREYLEYLYKNIFKEDANNSKEFSIFVNQKNPHPLRIKLEDYMDNKTEFINLNPNWVEEWDCTVELEGIIMEFIDNQNE